MSLEDEELLDAEDSELALLEELDDPLPSPDALLLLPLLALELEEPLALLSELLDEEDDGPQSASVSAPAGQARQEVRISSSFPITWMQTTTSSREFVHVSPAGHPNSSSRVNDTPSEHSSAASIPEETTRSGTPAPTGQPSR